MKYQIKKLPSGLTILEVPSNDAESVVVDFFVKTGSRSETPSENGISHFLEHFLFKGTKKYPSALAISEQVDAIGGEMNANTGKEHTQYFIKAASPHLKLIFEILTDMIRAPLLDPVELEREKGVIVEEINMYKDTPMAQIENVLEEAMWPKTALGRDIAGTRETVTKFTPQMFRSYIDRHYQAPNMILGISGKYNKNEFDRLVKIYWQDFKKKAFHAWGRVSDNQARPRLNVEAKNTEQAHLSLGFKSFGYRDRRNYMLSVLSAILGGGMSSRLFTEVRERRGLAYYVRAHSSHYQDAGVFNVGSGVKVEKIEEAIRVILAELKKITRENVGAKELNKAQEYLKGKTTLALEDNQTRLDWYLEQVAFHNKIETPQEVFKKIDSVSPSDIKNIARTIFTPKSMTLAVIGPYRNKVKQFQKLLKV